MNARQKNVAVFFLFTGLTLLFTYPHVLHLGSALRGAGMGDVGDPLLNTWAMAWDVHKISRLDFKAFFDANIFFPQSQTLLYSEHLLPQSLAALPILLISQNPILAYNLVLLLSFILSGFGMFCLARHLTKNAAAGIAAGLIYAFSPFMVAHLYQIQIISAWGIPFAFLFLHKYFEEDRLKPLLLFSLFYVLQCLANGYYALYLTLFAGLGILYWTVVQKKYKDSRFWAQMALLALLVLATAGPFFYQYAKVHNEMNFVRNIGPSAKLTYYLASPPLNRVYGRMMKPFLKPEGELFPGIIPVILGFLAILTLIKARKVSVLDLDRPPRILIFIRRAISVVVLIVSLLIIFMIGGEGGNISIGPMKLDSSSLIIPVLLWILLVLARFILDKAYGFKRFKPEHPEENNLKIYGIFLLLAFLFTFGPSGPYSFLYKYVPGFKSVRVATRFDIIVMAALAVLAAYGLKYLSARLSRSKKPAVAVLVSLLICVEYISVPIPICQIPIKSEISGAYQWLASTRKPEVLVELPLPSDDRSTASLEAIRMYYSTYHWRTLVNGYSGFLPPLYRELCRRMYVQPFEQTLKDLQSLNVHYILFHLDEVPRGERPTSEEIFITLNRNFRLVRQFGTDYVFEALSELPEQAEVPSLAGLKKVPRTGWTVHASANDDRARLAIDGSSITRWESGPQKPGSFFEIDLGKPAVCRCLSLMFAPSPMDFPRGYRMDISTDGVRWSEVAREEHTLVPIRSFIKPKKLALNIFIRPQEVRYIRITNLVEDPVYYWSIHEIDIFE